MKKIARLLLRIPYFYYWCWVQYPYNFDFWLRDLGLLKLSNQLLRELNIIVPKNYADFINKFPEKLFITPLATDKKEDWEKFVFYWCEEGKVKPSPKPGPTITITVTKTDK
jgi:hypothetical protein